MADLATAGGKLARLAADAAALGITFTGKIGDQPLRLKQSGDWPASAIRDLKNGDLSSWAEKCLIPEDSAKWVEMDPTLTQALEFVASFEEATGENVGESVTSQVS